MSEGTVPLLVEDDEDERDYPFAMIPVWVNFSGISNSAFRLYTILRSLVIDSAPRQGTRKLTDDVLCRLVERASGKKVTERTLYRWREELTKAGLLKVDTFPATEPGVGHSKARRRYRVSKFPPQGARVVRSAWDLLGELDEPDSEQTPSDSAGALTFMSEPVTKMSEEQTPLTLMSEGLTSMSENPMPDQPFLALHIPSTSYPSSSSSYLLQTSDRAAGGVGSGAKTRMRRKKDLQDNNPKTKTKEAIESQSGAASPGKRHRDKAIELVKALPGTIGKADKDKIINAVCVAFAEGWAPSAITAYLTSTCDLERAKFPGRVYAKNAADLPEPGPDERRGAERELCDHCDQWGITRGPAYATSDPEGDAMACLHGQPDPWSDPEYRERVIAARTDEQRRIQEAVVEQEWVEQIQREQAEERRLREEAREKAQVVVRRRQAREYLAVVESTGDPQADEIRRIMLELDDPVGLEELDITLSHAMGMIDSGRTVADVEKLLLATERSLWRSAMREQWTEIPA